MKLADQQLVLDTNILLHLLRGKGPAQAIEREYGVAQRVPRAVISIVVKGELKALAYKLNWGPDNHERVAEMLSRLPALDISSLQVIDAYAELDVASHNAGIKMGKNDLWIAATTKVLGGVLLTTDNDFAHLHPGRIRVERLDAEQLKAGRVVAL